MTPTQASLKFAFALDGLIRSRTKGDGGEEYARKCISEIAEALTELTTPTPQMNRPLIIRSMRDFYRHFGPRPNASGVS